VIQVGVIVGSTRPGRKAGAVARWVVELARQRGDMEIELVDLTDYELPLLDEPSPPSIGPYAKEHTRRWAATIDRLDAFVFVTPEYNHGPSGALKNAIDFLYKEWNNKAAGFISYGGAGGVRAVEQLRLVMAEVQIADVRAQVGLSLIHDFERFATFKPAPAHEAAVQSMFDQLVAWGTALRALRKTARP